MYAVIKTGGKQYKVSEGDVIYVEKLELADGAEVDFEVVMACNEGNLVLGAEAAKVTGKVVKTGKRRRLPSLSTKPRRTTDVIRATDSPIPRSKSARLLCNTN